MKWRRSSVVAFLPLMAVLAGCASPAANGAQVAATPESVTPLDVVPASVALETRTDFSDGSLLLERAETEGAVSAHWVAGRSQFVVVIFGSSTCDEIPISIGSVDATSIAVTFVPAHIERPDHACTTDRRPFAYFFSTPPSTAKLDDVTVAITFDEAGSIRTERIPIS